MSEHKLPEGLCARCQRPGHCCKIIALNVSEPREDMTTLEALAWLASYDHQPYIDGNNGPLPFLPTEEFRMTHWGKRRLWYCPKLTESGRCSIYSRRPKLCHDAAPGESDFCWHHDETVDPGYMKRDRT